MEGRCVVNCIVDSNNRKVDSLKRKKLIPFFNFYTNGGKIEFNFEGIEYSISEYHNGMPKRNSGFNAYDRKVKNALSIYQYIRLFRLSFSLLVSSISLIEHNECGHQT